MGFFAIFYHVVFSPFIFIIQGLSTPFIFIGQLLHSFVSDDTLECIDSKECKYPQPDYVGSRDRLGRDRTGSFENKSKVRNRTLSSLSILQISDENHVTTEDIPEQTLPTVVADYHAINIPYSTRQREKIDSSNLVFSNKVKALKEMKKYKDARFKSFQTFQAAEEFTKSNICPVLDDSVSLKLSGLIERGSYRMPRTVELLKMRELIETGQHKSFKQLIICNPYFLVSSGDTPPLLHVGARYNAFHIAAKMNKPEIIKIILDVIQEPNFFCRLYGINDDSICNRTERLVDFYLNTPDKGTCETPLHFACKAGNKDVIEVLVNHPLTKIDATNKFDKTPLDLIPDSISASSRKQIDRFFEERCYVPLYRDEDNLSPPRIGVPCSPVYTCDALSPPFSQVPIVDSPEGSPLSSRMLATVVKAYAGPMSPEQANDFRRNWKPSRDKDALDDMRSDQEKGYERIGRQLAQKFKFGWQEYWDFLNSYADISKPEGLEKLETYLQNQFLTFNVHSSLEALQVTDHSSSHKTHDPLKSLKNIFTVDNNKNVSGISQSLSPSEQQNKSHNPKKLSDAYNDIMESLAKEFGTKLVIVAGSKYDPDSSLTSNTSWVETVDMKDDHHHSVYTTLTNFGDLFNTVQDKQPLTVSLRKVSEPYSTPGSPVKENTVLPPDTVLLNVSSPSGLNLEMPAKPARTPPKSKTNLNVYLNGAEPTKLDLDVYRCLKDVELDSRIFPYINKWFQKVKSFTADEQQTWRSPAKCFNTARNQGSPLTHIHSRNQLGSSRKTLFGSPNH